MQKTHLVIFGFIGVVVLAFALIFLGIIPGLKQSKKQVVAEPPKTEISFWGLAGDESAWDAVIKKFTAIYPQVTIKYTGVTENRYEGNLIDNLAAGNGPDIFLLHNDWLVKHQNKIVPAPKDIIAPETIAEIFPKVVGEDFVKDGNVYALPTSINTPALLYNRDIFDAKQVATPPAGWEDIKALIPRLRELSGGRISREAIPLGGSDESVANAADLLTLIMLQFQSAAAAADKDAGIAKSLQDAANFYIDFSNPRSRVYTLDDSFENSLSAFADGKTAMVFVYPKDIKTILAKNQTISQSMRILPMPQIDPDHPVNLTQYWGMTVSKMSKQSALAWDFIKFATTDISAVETYATQSANSPALRATIVDYKDHPTLKVFAPQMLNAKSYPKTNADKAREIMSDMIKSALKDRTQLGAIVNDALNKLGAAGAR